MAATRAMLLHAGGVRSLVAAAVVTREQDASRVVGLCLDDGREDAAARRAAAELSAEALGIKRVESLALTGIGEAASDRDASGPGEVELWAARALPAALALARRHHCDRLIWPASAGASGDARRALLIAERAELVMALADLEAESMPRIDAPLGELSDAQVVALGERLGVDWRLARSCTSPTVGLGRPGCEACAGCERRARAFAAAAVVDPLTNAGPTRRSNAA
ncbi:MAG: 7-cyano-7-deazaguanine synthase [Planctomycetota bacterium]